jgi:hypothetical protein
VKVTILSFSYKRGLPEDKTGNGGGFVFDCRAMPNPYWDESLRGCTGCDKPVAEFFDRHKDKVDCFLGAAETLVRQSIGEYLTSGCDHLQIAFGCTGGQHRSVYFAERMAERLSGTDGVEIEVVHAAKPFWKVVKDDGKEGLSLSINEYGRYGRARDYVLCEDPLTDNTPKLNRKGAAFAVWSSDSSDDDGFYPCSTLFFDLPDVTEEMASTGGLGRSVSFNPDTEEFRFGPPIRLWDAVRPVDFEFYIAASRGTVDELKQLIAQGANPDAPVYDDADNDFYAIHQAALNPDVNAIRYVVSLGVDPCRVDHWGRQPLAFAVRRNSLEVARYLVEVGNDPCRQDNDGQSVLSEAALNPDIQVVEYLMSLGAKVDSGAAYMSELGRALAFGTPERMQFFMDHGADLARAMEAKANCAPLENIRYALEHGYDPNTFCWRAHNEGPREKVIDKLSPKRRKLFMEYGGKLHCLRTERWGVGIEDE